MFSSQLLYWNVLGAISIIFSVQSGLSFDPAPVDEYQAGIHRIVSQFLSDVHKTRRRDSNEFLSPAKVPRDKISKTNDIPQHTDHVSDNDKIRGGLFSKFPCFRMAPSKNKPVSVHELRPGDVNVVAAMGDSLTAGKAAGSKGVTAVLFDYRGLSWSIGGDGTFDTLHSLPNILREYNPDLYGFSNSIGDLMSQTARLNVAKSGATSDNLAFQAALLIQRLKNDPNVNFEKDWKVITILIGANDLCRSCKSVYTPQRYISRLKSALDILHDSVPRTFVNLVEVMPVELARFLPRDAFCERIETYYCGCAVNPKTETHYDKVISYRKEFQRLTEELVSSGIYDDKEDFTVVAQPFYKNFSLQMIPGTRDIDYSIFAVDCFHLSMKGQSRGGLGLWNNMLQPIGQKSTDWGITQSMLCPTETHPYLATAKNSKRLWGRFRGLSKHSWLKKIKTASVKELKDRGHGQVRSNVLNVIQKVKNVENEIKNSKTGKGNDEGDQSNDVIQSNVLSGTLQFSFNKTDESSASKSNTSTETKMEVVKVWLEDPEPWAIWSMVLGWTLLMSTVLLYCVTIRNMNTRGKSPLPPITVAVAKPEINKH